MVKEKTTGENLNNNLKRLSEITEWFDNQQEVDVEQGLGMVREAVGLIKASKERLKKIENEFEEIKKEVNLEEEDEQDNDDAIKNSDEGTNKETPSEDIPF
jgi:exonuclease VII small subunit